MSPLSSDFNITPEVVPRKFLAAGITCGIKASGKPDLALIVSEVPCAIAALFTTNSVKAAPILISQRHLKHSHLRSGESAQEVYKGSNLRYFGTGRAALVSSGNANAATGLEGQRIARLMCESVAAEITCKTEDIVIAQTGLIGMPLKESVVTTGSKTAANLLHPNGWQDAAVAMMTTDTHPKLAHTNVMLGGKDVRILGLAKGVAMASPAMATMIAVVTTDAQISPEILWSAICEAAEDSFHMLNIDGCRSTNDTVFVLANGAAGGTQVELNTPDYRLFVTSLSQVCRSLSMQMAGDAEGRKKFIRCQVKGALSLSDARCAARQVVGSVLVKCAIAGECAYWGRVIAEVGASSAKVDPDKISIWFGPFQNCSEGMACSHDVEGIKGYMQEEIIDIVVDLGLGNDSAEAYGSDLTHEYVAINMDKS